jgi:deazaflavin-dependent oxidoreductase (nitroreductase family)
VPLLFVETASGAPAIVGTNFGSEHDPLWVGNLLAEPHATWQAGVARPVVARKADEPEFAELWSEFVTMWPGYEMYAQRSGRRPMIFILDAANPGSQ